MRFWYVFVGCIFLFNPSIDLVDILPDFFGVALIMFGISKASALNTHIGIAYSKFKNAMWVSLGKLVCLFISGMFDKTMMLTLSLSAAVLECVFLVPAFSEMLDGMTYLCPGKINGDGQKTFGTLFLVLRSAGSFVPGVAAMFFDTSNGSVTSNQLSSSQIEGMLNILFVLAVGVVGVMWLCGIFKLVRSLCGDKALLAELSARYKSEILDNKAIMTERYTSRYTMLLSSALVVFITFKIENILIMPEFLFGVVALVAMALCGDYGKDKKTKILLWIFTAVSLADYVLMIVYSLKFGDLFAAYEEEGFISLFVLMALCGVMSYALLIACGARVCKTLKMMAQDSIVSFGESEAYRLGAITKRIGNMKAAICVYSAVGMAFSLLMPFFAWLWIIKFLLGIVIFVISSSVMKEISDEAKNAL